MGIRIMSYSCPESMVRRKCSEICSWNISGDSLLSGGASVRPIGKPGENKTARIFLPLAVNPSATPFFELEEHAVRGLTGFKGKESVYDAENGMYAFHCVECTSTFCTE